PAVPAPPRTGSRRGQAVLSRPVRGKTGLQAGPDVQGLPVALRHRHQRRRRRADLPLVRPSARVRLHASMTTLVTGATGFIGRRLVRQLIEIAGPEAVVCLVKPPATPLEAEALEAFRARGVRILEGDLLNQPVSPSPPPHVDRVFHLAANIDTDAVERELLVNHTGTRHLLDWLAPVSRGIRIVYASSVAVHDRDAEPRGPIDENSPLVPRTLYGKTKLFGEQVLRERAAADGYSWTILRLPTVYG